MLLLGAHHIANDQVKEETMDAVIFAVIGIACGIVIGFLVARYLVNASAKKKAE